MAKRPTISDQAAVAMGQDPSALVETISRNQLIVELLADLRRGGAGTRRSDIDAGVANNPGAICVD